MRFPLAVGLSTVLLVLAAAPAEAAKPSRCGPKHAVSWSSTPAQTCPLSGPLENGWVPVYAAPVAHPRGAPGPRVSGWLHGTTGQAFICQREFPGAQYYHPRGSRNRWWAYTKSDDGVWGWTPEVYFRGGATDKPDATLAKCSGNGPKPTPRKNKGKKRKAKNGCSSYAIFGLRGSGEPYAGPHNMGETVGRTADYAGAALRGRSVYYRSIPYPAVEAIELAKPGGRLFWKSMGTGQFMLKREIARSIRKCPRSKIGVIGYSQGAGVASEALRALPRRYFKQVRVAALYADTYSAGQTKRRSLSLDYTNPQRKTHFARGGKGIFGAKQLPRALRWGLDICFRNDVVCDAAPSTKGVLTQAFLADIHTHYKDWSSPLVGKSIPSFAGHALAQGLKQ